MEAEQAPEVVVVGEALGLFLATASTPLTQARDFSLGVAGAELNVAVGLSRLGHRTRFVGRVGSDPVGARVIADLRADAVDVRQVVIDPMRPTGLILRDTAAGRPVSVAYHRAHSAGSALCPDDIDPAAIADARVLHLTGVTAVLSPSSLAACRVAVQVARDAGVRISFDPNVRRRLADGHRWREVLDEFTSVADIVLAGADDLAACGVTEPAHVWLHGRGVRWSVVKDGARGASESHAGNLLACPAFAVPAVDPVGAGDAFAAGWLSAWLRDVDGQQRLDEAAVVAAAVVAARGDLTGLPTASERDQMLAGNQDVNR